MVKCQAALTVRECYQLSTNVNVLQSYVHLVSPSVQGATTALIMAGHYCQILIPRDIYQNKAIRMLKRATHMKAPSRTLNSPEAILSRRHGRTKHLHMYSAGLSRTQLSLQHVLQLTCAHSE